MKVSYGRRILPHRWRWTRRDRTHLDLHVDGLAEQAAEVERLISLGAVRVPWTYPEDADFVVLADPEGNLFCVVDKGGG